MLIAIAMPSGFETSKATRLFLATLESPYPNIGVGGQQGGSNQTETERPSYLQVTQPFLLRGVDALFLAVVGFISPSCQPYRRTKLRGS